MPDRKPPKPMPQITEHMLKAGEDVLIGYIGAADALPSWVSYRRVIAEIFSAMQIAQYEMLREMKSSPQTTSENG
ncbi:MAG TPA: hypothetical protein VKS24_24885 [Bradyrhizobium sp.]|nr:hypothetical protein [Bradyrhizobium sp.]